MRIILAVSGVIFLFSASSVAQTTAAGNGSISGRITFGGKGVAGISVVARVGDSREENRTVARTNTDGEGNYQLNGLTAGRFTIVPIAKAYVVAAGGGYKIPGQTVDVAENESVKNIDFNLVRGGVITGRITDLEGRPIIGERVSLTSQDGSIQEGSINVPPMRMMLPGGKNQTDDRGVYRLYGLAPGRYKVSVGQTGIMNITTTGSPYTKTYYPGVREESKATWIEIKEGAEVENIDITPPAKSSRGFSASGRVIDAESGQPITNVLIGYSSIENGHRQKLMNFFGSRTDANGSFRIEALLPGHYAAFMRSSGVESSLYYSDASPFEISDTDVSGIVIKVRRGATIDGIAVIENNADPAITKLLQSVTVLVFVYETKDLIAPSFSESAIGPDGSFRIAGLAPGKALINVQGIPNAKGLQLIRKELDGLDPLKGIEIAAGAHITGAKLVFLYGIGKLRGEVKIEGGVLLQGTPLTVTLRGLDNSSLRFVEVDARGRFFLDSLPPGNYELTVQSRSQAPLFEPVKRSVTIADDAEVPVTIVIDLAKKEGRP